MSGETTNINGVRPGRVTAFGGLALLCLGLVMALWAAPADAQEITVSSAATRLQENVYRLDADLSYEFSPPIVDALNSGVVLTISLDIEVFHERDLIWDDVVASLEQQYQLQYHALTEQYLLRNLNSGAENIYPTLDAALFSMGRVRELPLIDAQLVEDNAAYQVRIRAHLDSGSLPVPLQLRTYVSRDWQLSTDWFTWPLQR